jgi:hypothetical protein
MRIVALKPHAIEVANHLSMFWSGSSGSGGAGFHARAQSEERQRERVQLAVLNLSSRVHAGGLQAGVCLLWSILASGRRRVGRGAALGRARARCDAAFSLP